jgi:protein-S-isoprenylcysteine O-methyltransferase Ste14
MDDLTLYRILIVALSAFAAVIFFSLLVIPAPYGRHIRRGWGYTVRAKLGWLIMELPAFLVILIMYFLGDGSKGLVTVVFLVMWTAHYFQRTFIFPFLMKGGEKKFPVVLIVFALMFNTINGYVNGKYLFDLAPEYTISWFYDPRFIIGAIFFITGMVINLHSDHVLRILRRSPADGYKIPVRGLFRYISCPNYFGEIMEWTGWAIATWSIPGLVFALFTFANLAPRAFTNHRWYRESFPDYPEKRKALIPFIK